MDKPKSAKIFIAVAVVSAFVALLAVIAYATVIFSSRLRFAVEYYFVCYMTQDDAQSASSISSTVQSYGGAGYILKSDGKFYITVACYYSMDDAQSVCDKLKQRGLDCFALKAERDGYSLTTSRARGNAQKYYDTLSVLHSLSQTVYRAANALDGGTGGQEQAEAALLFVTNTLCGLARENSDNCFLPELDYIIAECEDARFGYIKSSGLRALQIAIADCILNIELN